MQNGYLIALSEFCSSHEIEDSFVRSLQENGLINITIIEDSPFIPADQLQQLEKFVHLHYELDINVEGIETVNFLLQRINALQDEIVMLKNRLRLYEAAE
jgi:hypothetical protein